MGSSARREGSLRDWCLRNRKFLPAASSAQAAPTDSAAGLYDVRPLSRRRRARPQQPIQAGLLRLRQVPTQELSHPIHTVGWQGKDPNLRRIVEVSVRRAVVHLVAPKRGELSLSDALLPAAPDVFRFLANHVEAGLSDPSAVAAQFVVAGDERTPALVDGILADPESLVRASQALARHLNTVVGADGRISDGALVVALCEGLDGGSSVQFVSILKLDPGSAYRPVRARQPDGSTLISLERQHGILPTNRERLQKAAFIRADEAGEEYRLLALDRQTATEPAQFFVARFLGAEDVLDPTQRTLRLYRSLLEARNEVAPQLTAAQLAAFERIVDGTMARTAVNVDELVETLPVPDEARARVETIIGRALPDREFDLDADRAQRLVRKRKFKGDNNLQLSVPSEFYDQMVEVTDVPGSNPPVREVRIRTRRWQEK